MASHWFFVYWYQDWKLKRLQSKCSHNNTRKGWDSGYTWTECIDCEKQWDPIVHVYLRDPSYVCVRCGVLFDPKDIRDLKNGRKFNYCVGCDKLYNLVEEKVKV